MVSATGLVLHCHQVMLPWPDTKLCSSFRKIAESVDYACTNKTVGPKPIEIANWLFGCLLHLVSFVKWRCLRSLPHQPASRAIVSVSGTAATDLEGRLGRSLCVMKQPENRYLEHP